MKFSISQEDYQHLQRSFPFCRILAASELRDIAADQQAELKSLQDRFSKPSSVHAESQHSACSQRFLRDVMQQDKEISGLRDLIFSWQEGVDSSQSFWLQQPACTVVLDKLHTMKRQLISLNEAHELSLQQKARGFTAHPSCKLDQIRNLRVPYLPWSLQSCQFD